MDWFKQLNISTKLFLLLGVFFLALIFIEFRSLQNLEKNLLDDRKLKTQHIAEVASGIMEYFHQYQRAGELTEHEAQTQAKEVIRQMRYADNQYLWLNNMRTEIIMHPLNPSLEGMDMSTTKDPNGVTPFQEFVDVVRRDGRGFVDYQWEKPGNGGIGDKTSYVIGFEPWEWVVGTGIYIDDIQEIYLENAVELIFNSVVVLLIVGAIAYFISRSLLIPIEKLRDKMVLVAENRDLTVTTNITGKNELGQMGRALNSLLDTFKQSINEVAVGVGQLKVASEDMRSIADSTNKGIQSQHADIDQVATAMEEMSATVNEVSENITNAATATEEANMETSKGTQLARQAKQNIEKLSLQVNQSSETVNGLEKDSENIGSILTVIRGIAEQTNLLALNAAIEAARAGEQGRGFAVVADEVRGLAKRTQDSIEEIESMIGKLQNGSQRTVVDMQESKALAVASVEQIEDLSHSLGNIDNTVGSIKQMSLQIAASAEEQASVANEISSSISSINGVAESTSQGAIRTTEASKELADLAEELRIITARFQV